MLRLRVSRQALRVTLGILVALGVLGGLYWLGALVTLRDGDGRLLVLTPNLRAAERYRGQARGWTRRMADVDLGLTGLLAADDVLDPGAVYAQSREMQRIGEAAADLVNDVDGASVPVALVGLRERAHTAAVAYLDAALFTADWLGEPTAENRREALERLRAARALRVTLEESRWLKASEGMH
jgi:hypothetical protein